MRLRRLASQTAIYGLSSVVGRALNWALTPLYANALQMEDFGRFSDLYALTFFPLILLTFGLETAFFRFASPSGQSSKVEISADKAYAASFFTVGFFGLAFGLLGLLFSVPLARVLGYGQHLGLVQLVLFIIVLDVWAALPLARLRQRERPVQFAAISLLNVGITLILSILLVGVFRLGIEWAFGVNAIASGLRLLMALKGNWPRWQLLERTQVEAMLRYGVWIMLAGLLGAVNETLDRALIPRLWPEGKVFAGWPRTGLELNAIYAANYKLAMIISLVVQAFRYAAEPFFFRHAADSRSPWLFARVFHYFTLLGLVVFLLVSAFAFDLVSFNFFGLTRYRLLPPTYWVGLQVVPILLMANLLLGAYVNLSIWFKLTGQVRYGLVIAAVGAALTIGINVATIPVLGYIGSAWATLVCYASMCALAYFLGQAYYPIPYRWARLGIYTFLFSVAVYFSVEVFKLHPGPKLLICTAVLLPVLAWEWRYPLKAEA
jgi:O-antigen/teichoic acid export membrane protein